MGPLFRFPPRLTALLAVLPRAALSQNLYPSGSGPFLTALTGGEICVDIAAGLFVATLVLVSIRRLIGSVPGAAMARLAMPASVGSARSGALQAAAGGGSHARPAAASAVSRPGRAETDVGKASHPAVRS